MNKVVYNNCYGGFNLSKEAVNWLEMYASDEVKKFLAYERTKIEKTIKDNPDGFDDFYLKSIGVEGMMQSALKNSFEGGMPRHHKDLVACVEALKDLASGFCSELDIHILKGNMYRIEEYDGLETVIEPEDENYIHIQ